MLVYRETAKYGVQTTFIWALEDVTDAEAPFTGVAPLTADIWISKDGGAAANATNAMTAVSNGFYTWVATATEMQATRVSVSIYDATASAIFKPIYAVITTKLQLGQIDVDATAIGSNTHAIVGTGVGTGSGVHGIGGATGDGIEGVGGATSGIGLKATATATTEYNNMFAVTFAEPSAVPSSSSAISAWLMTFCRRWLNKTTQSSSSFTQYKDDDSTALYTRTVADTGGTATLGPAV